MWEQKNDDQNSLNEITMEPIESWEGTATEVKNFLEPAMFCHLAVLI